MHSPGAALLIDRLLLLTIPAQITSYPQLTTAKTMLGRHRRCGLLANRTPTRTHRPTTRAVRRKYYVNKFPKKTRNNSTHILKVTPPLRFYYFISCRQQPTLLHKAGRAIIKIAGPIKINMIVGKINKVIGKSIFTGAFCASCSANCRRFTRISSD